MNKVHLKDNWRRLDNTAKIFSLENKKNANVFRCSIVLKQNVDGVLLQHAVKEALHQYPAFKVKIKAGLFWHYLEDNFNLPIVEEQQEKPHERIQCKKNRDYLFKVTYFRKKINLDIFHVLTDGLGATVFLKAILYHYLNLKYKLKPAEEPFLSNFIPIRDAYINKADKSFLYKEKRIKPFLIKEKSDLLTNKSYHYILNLTHFKKICKEHNVSITKYLMAIYIYALYKSVYNKSSNSDIVITVPIDLRKHYQVETFSNFFTCMSIEGGILNQENISFESILQQVDKEFANKLTEKKIKKYLSKDVKLGTNIGIRLVPLFIKKIIIKHLGKIFSKTSTSTFSNIGAIQIDKQYQKYVDNIIILVNAGKIQKTKCTICSFENKLTVTLNSNLTSNRLEKEFHKLLIKYVGKVNLKSNFL